VKTPTPTQLEASLAQFSGTADYYQHAFGRLVYTDGVKYLADQAGAYWLIDAIASYQADRRLTAHRMLRDLQFWTLTVQPDHSALLTCIADTDLAPAISQRVEWTDFPFAEVKVWVERSRLDGKSECMIAMLPGER
jgi:hypothetical protein